MVLSAADLFAAWKGTAHHDNPNDASWRASFVKCLAVRDTYRDRSAEAYSPNFALGNSVVLSNATSYRSQTDVDADVAAIRGPRFSPCVDALMKQQSEHSVPPGTPITASFKIILGSNGGPANVVGTGTGTIRSVLYGRRVVFYLSFAYIIGPLLEAEVDTSGVGAAVAPSEVKRLVAAVATRAAKG